MMTKLTNAQIYSYAIALNEAFKDDTQKLPVKINFYLQKNKNVLTTLGQDIEETRMKIIRENGNLSEDGTQFIIPKEKLGSVQQELDDLLGLLQEVNIYTVKLDSFSDDIALTTAQMDAMMFMIDED